MANIYLLYASTDYWREDSLLNPFLHMWSLGVEFQYYVIFPILVFLFFRFASSSPLIRSACLTIFVFAGVASLFSFLLGETYELKKFYSAQYRICEFNIGIGAYLCVIRFKGSYLRAGALVTSMRLILNDVTYTILIIAFVFIGLEFMDRRSLTAFSCLMTGAFLILNAHPASSISSPLSNRLAVIIGDNSYSLYLVHFSVIFVFYYMMVFDTTWVYLSCILTIFALSYITWLFVEQSIRQRGSHKQVLRTTCATMLVAFVVADNSNVVRRLPFYSTIGLAANSDGFHNFWWTRLEETGHLFKHAATFKSEQGYREYDGRTSSSYFAHIKSPTYPSNGTLIAAGNSYVQSSGAMLLAFAEKNNLDLKIRHIMNCSDRTPQCGLAFDEVIDLIKSETTVFIYTAFLLPENGRAIIPH